MYQLTRVYKKNIIFTFIITRLVHFRLLLSFSINAPLRYGPSLRNQKRTKPKSIMFSTKASKQVMIWTNWISDSHFSAASWGLTLMSVEVQLCLQCAYHGRCWGTCSELSCFPREGPLLRPPGRPSAVSRPPLPLFWGSSSCWRGMATLCIHILYVNHLATG